MIPVHSNKEPHAWLPARAQQGTLCALLLLAVVVGWQAVGWSVRQSFFLYADEIGNLLLRVQEGPAVYRNFVHFLPRLVYGDRPVGFVLEWFLYDAFGFQYWKQLLCMLAIHGANCALLFWLLRRIGLRAVASIGCVAAFAGLSTTALTATYLGGVFDLLATLFILAGTLAILRPGWAWTAASAVLYLLALRSKEFAISLPLILAVLLATRLDGPFLQRAKRIAQRLWLHFLLMAVFGIRYAYLLHEQAARLGPASPYHLGFAPGRFADTLLYYTSLIFCRDANYQRWALPVVAILLAALAYSAAFRLGPVLFGITAYAMLLVPVCLLPNIRSVYYCYGPQAFLLAAIALIVQDAVLRWLPVGGQFPALCAVTLAVFGVMAAVRTSDYFRDRVRYMANARTTCATTARSATVLAGMGSAAHVYLNHGDRMPYLFTAGPGDYLRCLKNSAAIGFVWQKPEAELRGLYDRDDTEKYLLDYSDDGTLVLRDSSRRRSP